MRSASSTRSTGNSRASRLNAARSKASAVTPAASCARWTNRSARPPAPARHRPTRQQQAELAQCARKRDALQDPAGAARGTGGAAARRLHHRRRRAAQADAGAGQGGRRQPPLAYHRYLQRDRARRIATLPEELAELERVERETGAALAALDARKAGSRTGAAGPRPPQRSATVAQLDHATRTAAARAGAGRDAKALQKCWRSCAPRGQGRAERRAAAAAARERRRPRRAARRRRLSPRRRRVAKPRRSRSVAWAGRCPGSLIAGYGGTMPDGRKSPAC